MRIFSFFTGKENGRCAEFSVERRHGGCEFNIHSVETLRSLFLKHSPLRYKPLVALLRTAMRHTVMIAADGEDWQKTHDAINPEFLAGIVASQYVPVIRAVADDAFARLVRLLPEADGGRGTLDIEVESLMRAVTSSVLGHLLFGETLDADEADWLEKTLSAVTQVRRGPLARINRGIGVALRAVRLGERQPMLFPREQRVAIAELLDWIGAKIDGTELSSNQPPLLEGLKQRYAGQRPADRRRSIAAEYGMLLIAGIETTASALTFAIAEIASDPEVRDGVVREARLMPERRPGSQPVATQYPYVHCVFRETLRRHTIVPTLLREAEEEYRVSGTTHGGGAKTAHRIPAGSTVRYLAVKGHMHHGVWSDPHRFDPARFARPLTPEQSRHYIPFGFGPQRCPGHALATTEAILILLAFFRRFDVEAGPTASIRTERNILFTNRPIGAVVRVRAALPTGGPDGNGAE